MDMNDVPCATVERGGNQSARREPLHGKSARRHFEKPVLHFAARDALLPFFIEVVGDNTDAKTRFQRDARVPCRNFCDGTLTSKRFVDNAERGTWGGSHENSEERVTQGSARDSLGKRLALNERYSQLFRRCRSCETRHHPHQHFKASLQYP